MKLLCALAMLAISFASCQKNPEAEVSSQKNIAETGEEIYFRNGTSNAYSYHWDFGDGTSSTEKEPVKAFDKAGEFQVKLVAFSKNREKQDEASLALVINNANEKFVGLYDASGCNTEGQLSIGAGPSGNEVVLTFMDTNFDGSVSGQALIIPRKQVEEDGFTYAYSGTGNLSGNKLSVMWKTEVFDPVSAKWLPGSFCTVTGSKLQ